MATPVHLPRYALETLFARIPACRRTAGCGRLVPFCRKVAGWPAEGGVRQVAHAGRLQEDKQNADYRENCTSEAKSGFVRGAEGVFAVRLQGDRYPRGGR